ncbi:MAG: alpha/beta hydrolase [Chloroflexota bacterium]
MSTTFQEGRLKHRFATVNGVRLHFVEAGSGPLVILLHGFPEFWYAWRHQIPALAQNGFRVVALDMRGYNLSDKPRGVRAYAADLLAGDVAGIIAACGSERASVVGHDWGGLVAWQFAMRHPQALDRLVIMNAPHPERFLRGVRSPRQAAKSSYILFYALPAIPEAVLRAGDFAILRQVFRRDPVRPNAFSAVDIDERVHALARAGALTAALNYYRAMIFPLARRQGSHTARIDAPVLVIWGERDRYLGSELAQPSLALVPNATVERLPDASHWVQADAPERVNDLLLAFLSPNPGT